MVVGFPVMRFHDSGFYLFFNWNRNREWERGGGVVVLMPGVGCGEGSIGGIPRSQLGWR